MEQDRDETESLVPLVSCRECDKTLTNFQYFMKRPGPRPLKDKQTVESEIETRLRVSLPLVSKPR